MDTSPRKLAIAAAIVAFVIGAVMVVTRGDRSRDLVLQIEPHDPEEEVVVFVTGEVRDEGLYSLPRGSRISDALDLAGYDDSADLSGFNLASALEDEQAIVVPRAVERDADTDASPGTEESPPEQTDERIDINAANAYELQALPGVGPAIAERIVNHRDSEGSFDSLDELTNVRGISERMVEDFRDIARAGP